MTVRHVRPPCLYLLDVVKHIHFNLMVCGLLNSSIHVIIVEAGKKSPSTTEAGASAQRLMNSRVLLCASKCA